MMRWVSRVFGARSAFLCISRCITRKSECMLVSVDTVMAPGRLVVAPRRVVSLIAPLSALLHVIQPATYNRRAFELHPSRIRVDFSEN